MAWLRDQAGNHEHVRLIGIVGRNEDETEAMVGSASSPAPAPRSRNRRAVGSTRLSNAPTALL